MTSKQEAFWILRTQFGDREAMELLLLAAQPALSRYLQSLTVFGAVFMIVLPIFRMTHKVLRAIEVGIGR